MAEKSKAPDPGPAEEPNDGPTETPAAPPEKVRLPDGIEVDPSEIVKWRDRAKNLEAGYQKKREILNRDFEKRLEERVAALMAERSPEPAPEGPDDYKNLDDYVPGLGKVMSRMGAELNEIKKAQTETREASKKYLDTAQREDFWDSVLSEFDGKPLANIDQMRSFMEAHGWDPTPENAEAAYFALNGFKLGEISESERARQAASTPAPMGGSEAPIPSNTAQETLRGRKKPISETSFEELRDAAMNDPRARRYLVNR